VTLTKIEHSHIEPWWNQVFGRRRESPWAMRFSISQMRQAFLRCTSLQRRRTNHCPGGCLWKRSDPLEKMVNSLNWLSLILIDQNQWRSSLLTSSIWELRIVATAWMIDSTSGLSIVVLIKMELSEFDFLSWGSSLSPRIYLGPSPPFAYSVIMQGSLALFNLIITYSY